MGDEFESAASDDVASAVLMCRVVVLGRQWRSLDAICCRGRKIRLQLRSSLATSAKKVFGKQRLTRLVHVSFPAPDFDLQARRRLQIVEKGLFAPFFIPSHTAEIPSCCFEGV
ncbi:hypothetical protein [Pigmentiphaga daeguensis]|uniref:hypothetical protein n=1 Tax=Pigmentiphaga daeguensis TaxID=414049 RepID=UPI0031D3A315